MSDDIARMANQIADFFAGYPAEEAEEGVARHIRDFWDPRMRAALAALLSAGAPALSALARAGAIRALGTAPGPEVVARLRAEGGSRGGDRAASLTGPAAAAGARR